MSTCKDCKFWSKDREERLTDGDLRICTKVRMFWDCTEWGQGSHRKLNEDSKNDKAFAKDGSDYKAILITMESFGCNQFEPK